MGLIFGEGVFDLHLDDDAHFGGTLNMGADYALTLTGTIDPGWTDGAFGIVGLGIDDTPTAGWRHDYRGVPAAMWPNAVAQIPCLLSTVIRMNPHGPNAPAGVTASFVAVRQSNAPAPDTVPPAAPQ